MSANYVRPCEKCGHTPEPPEYLYPKVAALPLPDRLRVMAQLMHIGAAWGFSAEGRWLEQAADQLENLDEEGGA